MRGEDAPAPSVDDEPIARMRTGSRRWSLAFNAVNVLRIRKDSSVAWQAAAAAPEDTPTKTTAAMLSETLAGPHLRQFMSFANWFLRQAY